MTTIENDFLRVVLNAEGAELCSIFDKARQREWLWQADPTVWPRHAPNLFPVVGACLDNQLEISGTVFNMPKHGFARDSHFSRLEASALHAKYSLHHSKDTYKVYPFKFEFQVLYDLKGDTLRISYKVINLDKDTVWFSLGAHPAFNVPFNKDTAYEDHYIEFETEEVLNTYLISPAGYLGTDTEPVPLDGKKLRLTRQLFDKDALVFKNLRSRKVTLANTDGDGSLTIAFPHFNYLGIWAKPGADFVCIEPWLGVADTAGKRVPIQEKEGILRVEHGHVFETEMTITANR